MTRDSRGALIVFSILFFATCLYRLSLCMQAPEASTDVLRNLGMASHLSETGFDFYRHTAKDFLPEPWARIWPEIGYPYPPAALVFFFGFAKMGLGIFYVKLVLTALEAFNSLMLARRLSLWPGLLYFLNPVSMYYGSHEGQFEPLQATAIILCIILVQRRSWIAGGCTLALACQIKLFGILLLPWVMQRIWMDPGNRSGNTRKLTLGLLLGFLPFAGFYLSTPALVAITLKSTGMTWNPFHWNIFNPVYFRWTPSVMVLWNALFSWGILVLLLAAAGREWIRDRVVPLAYAPLAAFWAVIKSLPWGQNWYPIVAPSFLFTLLDRRRLVAILLVLHTFQCGRSVLLLSGHHFGYREGPNRVRYMEEQLYRFDPAAPLVLPR